VRGLRQHHRHRVRLRCGDAVHPQVDLRQRVAASRSRVTGERRVRELPGRGSGALQQDLGPVQVRIVDAPLRRRGVSGVVRGLLALPTLAWVAIFFVVPLGMVIVYSFATISLVTFDTSFGWTLSNYRQIYDPLYLHTFVRSIFLSLATTLGCLLLGFPLAYFISRQTPRWQRLWL